MRDFPPLSTSSNRFYSIACKWKKEKCICAMPVAHLVTYISRAIRCKHFALLNILNTSIEIYFRCESENLFSLKANIQLELRIKSKKIIEIIKNRMKFKKKAFVQLLKITQKRIFETKSPDFNTWVFFSFVLFFLFCLDSAKSKSLTDERNGGCSRNGFFFWGVWHLKSFPKLKI